MKYLLDTNTLSYLIKGRGGNIITRLSTIKCQDIYVPSIAYCELLFGAKKIGNQKLTEAIENLVSPFKIVPFTRKEASVYALIRNDLEQKGTPIGAMDLLIAAIAVAGNYTLVSHNCDEFKRVESLLLEDWTCDKTFIESKPR